MKEQYLINAKIIDPKNQINEIGGLIIDSKGLIKAVGKKVSNGNLPSSAVKIDLKNYCSPGSCSALSLWTKTPLGQNQDQTYSC